MSVPAKISDLIGALEFESEEHQTWFDRQTGQIVMAANEVMTALEEGDDERLAELPDWQKEEIETGRQVMEDTGERFIDAPDKFDFHEYRHMERFVRSIPDESDAEQLWRAIKGKGAFRSFKDTLRRLGIENLWYRYRDEAMKDFAIAWAESNKIPYIDDTAKASDNQGV